MTHQHNQSQFMMTGSGSTPEASSMAVPSERGLRGFWALVATQFQGAFSDNLLRNLLLSMVVGMGLARSERESFVSLVTFLFSLPFILFSMAGGWLADRFSKRQITIWTKLMEIASMVLAAAGLAAHSLPFSLAALTLVATQAALFGPSKYGLLPELLPEKRLSWGNGVIELGTFLAIILGTVAGATMAEHFRGHEVYAGYALLALAAAGLLSSLGIDRVPAAAPRKPFRLNFISDLWQQIRIMRRDRALFLAVAGNTYFWFLGSLLFSTIVVYGPDVLHVGMTKTGYLNATLAIGIGIGSMVAGVVSGNKIEYGLIPLGSIGMTVTGLLLGLRPHGLLGSAVLLGILGFWAGFFAVPVNALVQHRPAEEDKGGIIAAANLLSFVGIALSSGAYYLFTEFIHLNPRGVMVAASLITAAGTVYVLMLLPEWFARLLLFFATHTGYRVKVLGRDNFPEKSGALLVCNHMSFVDAMLLVASTDRPIRFLVYKGWSALFRDIDAMFADLHSYLGCVTVFIGSWAIFTSDWTAVAWAVLMLSAAWVSRWLASKHLVVQAWLLAGAAFFRVAITNCHWTEIYHACMRWLSPVARNDCRRWPARRIPPTSKPRVSHPTWRRPLAEGATSTRSRIVTKAHLSSE